MAQDQEEEERVVPAHKQNTVLKLVAKHWNGRLDREALAARLAPELWDQLQSCASREEMLRRAKTYTNSVLKSLRLEKGVERRSERLCQGKSLLDKYGLLAAPAPDIADDECWKVDWLQMPKPCIPELNCLPLRGYFERRDWPLLWRELAKLKEKRRQVEYMVGLVLAKLEERRVSGLPHGRVVDFAGGRGDLALALAWALKARGLGERLSVVELKEDYVAQGRKRAHESGLGDCLTFVQQDLRDFDEPFDVAVACHACGGLIDLILERCLAAAESGYPSSFALLTCCFGKIRKQATPFCLQVPPAGGAAVEHADDFWALCGLADSARPHESSMAMRVINCDRIALCRRRGVWVQLRAIPREITNKNLVLSDSVVAARTADVLPCLLPKMVPVLRCLEQGPRIFRVVAVSDTHGRHRALEIPPADLLVHCGDFTKAGELAEVADFADWLEAQPCSAKVIVAGNHEVSLDADYFCRQGHRFQAGAAGLTPAEREELAAKCRACLQGRQGVVVLENESARVGPVQVWGSPCQGAFFSGHSMAAFGLQPGAPWPEIPDGVDIVVTHGPPHGACDLSGEKAPAPQRAGCPRLRDAVERAKPVVHFFGHIHEGYGAAESSQSGTLYLNAATCTERYLAMRLPVVVDLPLCPGSQGLVVDRSRRPEVWLAARGTGPEVGAGEKHDATPSLSQDKSSPDAVSAPFLQRLVTELHAHPELHAGSATTAYRNKASYLLGKDFVGENAMCEPALNKVAAGLQLMASKPGGEGSPEWVEAALKLTRRGTVGVKLLLRGFRAEDGSPEWLAPLLKDCPEVTSVSVQPCPEGSGAKPGKSPWDPRYVAPVEVHGPLWVIEETPPVGGQPGVPFRLSPDSFSEVNSPAEDAMFAKVLTWARQLRRDCPRLALLGRNSGFYGLALQRELCFEEVRGCTHCPMTAADAEASIEMHAGSPWLPAGSETFRFSRVLKDGFARQIRDLAGGPQAIVHVTNNRHGLADGVVDALAETECVRAVLYNSCNHGCLAREWARLLPAGFEIAEFASSDLLAGTEFDSSIYLLLRRPRTLVLPVGPPTSGKSSLARALAAAGAAQAPQRPFAQVFERDLHFASERGKGLATLKEAKARTHSALLRALEAARAQASSVLCVDSTNAAREARMAYRQAMRPLRVVYLLLGMEAAVPEILERVRRRQSRADCPSHEQKQWEKAMREGLEGKVRRLVAAIEAPCSEEMAGEDVEVLRCATMPSKEELEALAWRLFLLITCPALLRVLRPLQPPARLQQPEVMKTCDATQGRIALCFLTSARAADADGSVLWNDAAWQWLVQDFEERSSQALESCFLVLRHDDSEGDDARAGFLARAERVRPVATKRAGLSLVLAELRLLRAALAAGCDFALLLSGSCLPLRGLDGLREELLSGGKSVLQYHFCKGGHQRLFGIEYGALQWKAWHRRDMELLAGLEEEALKERWQPQEALLQKYNLAPDEVALVAELRERLGPLEERCLRRPVTYLEWEEKLEEGPRRARTFWGAVPEKAWAARDEGALLVRKVSALGPEALKEWQKRLRQ